MKILSGWWFGTFFIFPYIGLLIIPTDFHIFQRGGPTTTQLSIPGFDLNGHGSIAINTRFWWMDISRLFDPIPIWGYAWWTCWMSNFTWSDRSWSKVVLTIQQCPTDMFKSWLIKRQKKGSNACFWMDIRGQWLFSWMSWQTSTARWPPAGSCQRKGLTPRTASNGFVEHLSWGLMSKSLYD